MADEAREVAPVKFFNDPRLPLEGIKDFSPKPQSIPQRTEPPAPDPKSKVYGGQLKPTPEQPVVTDGKAPVAVPVRESDRNPEQPAQERSVKDQEAKTSTNRAKQSTVKDQESGGAAPADTAVTAPSKPKSVSDKPAQTPSPQTSEPTNAEVEKPSTASKTSSSTGSSSKTSATKKKSTGTTNKE